jgi:hypothetical protein
MHRIRRAFAGAIVGAVVLGASASGASAAGQKLELRTENASFTGAFQPGDGFGLAETFGELEFKTPNGSIDCRSMVFSGTFVTNFKPKDVAELSSERTNAESEEGPCTTSGAAFPSEPTATASGFPWSLSFTAKGIAEVKAPSGAALTFTGAEGVCSYSVKTIKGTFNIDGNPITIFFPGTKLKRATGSSEGCAKQIEATGQPYPFGDGGYVEAIAYSGR